MRNVKRPTVPLDSTERRRLEDAADLEAFETRANEPDLNFETFVRDLKSRGKL
ncbi:MAG: hypothetical protein HY049_02125 [Acidobacteria bacterium]|nr:hypothetical protein [Acidobacteriota bacterium]